VLVGIANAQTFCTCDNLQLVSVFWKFGHIWFLFVQYLVVYWVLGNRPDIHLNTWRKKLNCRLPPPHQLPCKKEYNFSILIRAFLKISNKLTSLAHNLSIPNSSYSRISTFQMLSHLTGNYQEFIKVFLEKLTHNNHKLTYILPIILFHKKYLLVRNSFQLATYIANMYRTSS